MVTDVNMSVSCRHTGVGDWNSGPLHAEAVPSLFFHGVPFLELALKKKSDVFLVLCVKNYSLLILLCFVEGD